MELLPPLLEVFDAAVNLKEGVNLVPPKAQFHKLDGGSEFLVVQLLEWVEVLDVLLDQFLNSAVLLFLFLSELVLLFLSLQFFLFANEFLRN